MRTIVITNRFEKRLVVFVKQHPELRIQIEKAIQLLAVQDILPSTLRAHKLAGVLQDCTAVRISHSFRLIFKRTKEEQALIDIGSHDDVYR